MRKGIKLTTVFFVFAFTTSCQKKFTDEEAFRQIPEPASQDSVARLFQFIIMNGPNALNEPYCVYEYHYDSLKRVSSINIDVVSVPILYSVVTYFYNGADSTPYKKTKKFKDPIYIRDSTSSFYFYDNAQRLIKDSIVFSYATEVDQYAYSDTMITAAKRHVENVITPNNPNFEVDTAFIGPTGDIVKTNSFNSGSFSTILFTYDDKPNPFNQLNIRATYSPVPGRDYYIADFYLQKNNITYISQDYNGFPPATSTSMYNYVYDGRGLPTSADIINHLGTRSDYGIRFVYK